MTVAGVTLTKDNYQKIVADNTSKAKFAEFFIAPSILYQKGLKGYKFEYLDNAFFNKITALVIGTLSAILTLGFSVKWAKASLNEAKENLRFVDKFKAQGDLVDKLYSGDARFDSRVELNKHRAEQAFVAAAKRIHPSDVSDCIRTHKSKLENPHVALTQLFPFSFTGTMELHGKRIVICNLIFNNFEIQKQHKANLVRYVAMYGGDDFLEAFTNHVFLKGEKDWITQEWLSGLINDVINWHSQGDEGHFKAKREQFIQFLMTCDEILDIDVQPSKDALQASLADAVRMGSVDITQMILKKAKKLDYALNLTSVKSIARACSPRLLPLLN